jgi:hypothetical protein
MRPPQN